jgi:cupin fold WbuC family metalloprotein
MRTREFNEEVLFATDTIVSIDAKDIEDLKQKARHNKRRRIRLCVHKGHEENIHEMLIVHEEGCYVRPHKHINKIESFHIVEGTADIVLFDDDGKISDTIPMGHYGTGRKFFYRLPSSLYHTLSVESEFLIFHEITKGPYRPGDTVWAQWAPEESDKSAVSMYLKWITNYIEENSEHG